MRPVQRAGEPAVVQLQPGEPPALVLPGVDPEGAEERRALYLHFTMEDNPALTPRIRARYRSAYSGVFYRRFVLGEWTAAQGLVYDFFDRERDSAPVAGGALWAVADLRGLRHRQPRLLRPVGPTGRSLVPGGGVLLRLPPRRDGRRPTRSTSGTCERLAGDRQIERVIVDPSAASFIEALRRRGLPRGAGGQRRGRRHPGDGGPAEAAADRHLRAPAPTACGRWRLYCWDDTGRAGRAQKGAGPRHGRSAATLPWTLAAGERRRLRGHLGGAAGVRTEQEMAGDVELKWFQKTGAARRRHRSQLRETRTPPLWAAGTATCPCAAGRPGCTGRCGRRCRWWTPPSTS